MLHKNNELYKLTPADVKQVKDKFGAKSVRLVYPPDRIQEPRGENRLPDKPNSISIPLTANERTASGSTQWRYFENVVQHEKKGTVYSPHKFMFNGGKVLDVKNDIELIWFLYTKSPFVENGLNMQPQKVSKMMFEDKVGVADKKAELAALKSDIQALIYSNTLGLPEKQLRVIAKAFFIPEVDELTLNQVRVQVMAEVDSRGKDGYEKFQEFINQKDILVTRSKIQQAVDLNLIKFIVNNRTWIFTDPSSGRKTADICTVTAGTNQYDGLYDHYNGNNKFAEELDAILKGQRVLDSVG
jgi:hypothetical protein